MYRRPVHLMFLTDSEGYQGVELLLEELLPPFQLTNTVVDPRKGGQRDVPRFVPEFVDLDQVVASLDQDSLDSIKALKSRFNSPEGGSYTVDGTFKVN